MTVSAMRPRASSRLLLCSTEQQSPRDQDDDRHGGVGDQRLGGVALEADHGERSSDADD